MRSKALLFCGIASSLLYGAMIGAIRFEGYSHISQTPSELSAIGAPTRSLWPAPSSRRTTTGHQIRHTFCSRMRRSVWASVEGSMSVSNQRSSATLMAARSCRCERRTVLAFSEWQRPEATKGSEHVREREMSPTQANGRVS